MKDKPIELYEYPNWEEEINHEWIIGYDDFKIEEDG